MGPIVVATSNPNKVREIAQILAAVPDLRVELLSLGDVREADALPEPAEDGQTFEDNAAGKAAHYARGLGRPCLADDSGLEVDALKGAPGVISARYAELTAGAGPFADRAARDRANNETLLAALDGVPPERRTARFVCTMCLADPADLAHEPGAPSRSLILVRGTFEGRIGMRGQVPRGHNGFGYDPLFLAGPDFAQTAAELTPDEKNRRSHRGVAARLLARRLAALRA